MAWLFLAIAITSEIAGTLALRMASVSNPRWWPIVVAAYAAAFIALSMALRDGLPLGVAYGVWAASGVALTAVASRVLFGEALNPLMVFGIVLIGCGVLLVESGTGSAGSSPAAVPTTVEGVSA
ncbi:DMT family transporter [Kribbella sp. NPDC051620]|uniref:DMT family transporter n=1 Tax=Kribbella sp. NPDC051620 TaxID=3364120 RepID=UPI0037B586CB